jgi:hypothetical protein
MRFVILSSKPAVYHTDANDDLHVMETWDYRFCGQVKTSFAIAELLRVCKVRVTDEAPPERVTWVPCKFLPSFESLEAARRELRVLVGFGSIDAELDFRS